MNRAFLEVGALRDGALALRLHKPWFRFRVTVTDANGALLGHVRRRIRLGTAVFTVTGPSGEPIGKLLAENWRSKDFRLEASSGHEVARVTKKWRGAESLRITARSHRLVVELARAASLC